MKENREKNQKLYQVYRKIQATPALKSFLIIVLVILIIPLYRFISSLGVLDIREVSIRSSTGEDLKYIEKKSIREKVLDENNLNYFEIDLNKLKKNVSAGNPFISDIYFSKSFPSSLNVEIVQRLPYLIVQIDNSECNVITQDAFVLDKLEVEGSEGCNEAVSKYKMPVLKTKESKIPFDVNTQSAFLMINDIDKIRKVFGEYGVYPERYELNGGVLFSYIDKDTYIVTSTNQDIMTQLSRFVVVIQEIEERGIQYKSMDLRYKRPVINRK